MPLNFRSRVREGNTFGKYIPDFEYYLVPLQGYSNEALMEKRDEISLVMLITLRIGGIPPLRLYVHLLHIRKQFAHLLFPHLISQFLCLWHRYVHL